MNVLSSQAFQELLDRRTAPEGSGSQAFSESPINHQRLLDRRTAVRLNIPITAHCSLFTVHPSPSIDSQHFPSINFICILKKLSEFLYFCPILGTNRKFSYINEFKV